MTSQTSESQSEFEQKMQEIAAKSAHLYQPRTRTDHLPLKEFKLAPEQVEPIYALQYADPIRAEAPKPTLYIAGPMTGHQGFNYAAFNAAAADLRAAGHTVLNPAENPQPNPNPTWQDWMRVALGQLIQADGIALLPGWLSSRGAKVENDLGHALGLDVRHIGMWLTLETFEQNIHLYTPSASTK